MSDIKQQWYIRRGRIWMQQTQWMKNFKWFQFTVFTQNEKFLSIPGEVSSRGESRIFRKSGANSSGGAGMPTHDFSLKLHNHGKNLDGQGGRASLRSPPPLRSASVKATPMRTLIQSVMQRLIALMVSLIRNKVNSLIHIQRFCENERISSNCRRSVHQIKYGAWQETNPIPSIRQTAPLVLLFCGVIP